MEKFSCTISRRKERGGEERRVVRRSYRISSDVCSFHPHRYSTVAFFIVPRTRRLGSERALRPLKIISRAPMSIFVSRHPTLFFTRSSQTTRCGQREDNIGRDAFTTFFFFHNFFHFVLSLSLSLADGENEFICK